MVSSTLQLCVLHAIICKHANPLSINNIARSSNYSCRGWIISKISVFTHKAGTTGTEIEVHKNIQFDFWWFLTSVVGLHQVRGSMWD